MRRISSFLFLLTMLVTASAAFAQAPPDISRWSGGTASAQPQGFSQGSPLTLTWGFAALGSAINNDGSFANGNNNLQTRLNTIYGSQATWQPIFAGVFNRWNELAGLTYIFEAADDGAALSGANAGVLGVRADVRISGKTLDGNSGVLAYNWFPNRGDMVIDTNDTFFDDTSSSSIRLRNVVSHEHGHGLGMSHVESSNGAFLMEPFYTNAFDGPQFHDILVAHRGYGDVREKSFAGLGNDVAARATALGNVVSGGSVSIGNDARNLPVAPTETDFISIDDNTDTDFLSFSISAPGTINILLEALGHIYQTGPQGGTQVAFDTRLRSDLSLALFDTNGTSLLISSNTTSFGGNETISNFFLGNAGTYFVRIQSVDNPDSIALDTQFYGLNVSFVSVPEPGSIALLVGLGITWSVSRRRRK
ncbi:MAG: matrixin family metalloprotease [Pirellulaceae bacterium]